MLSDELQLGSEDRVRHAPSLVSLARGDVSALRRRGLDPGTARGLSARALFTRTAFLPLSVAALVQAPASARYPGMPDSAIASFFEDQSSVRLFEAGLGGEIFHF